MEKTTQKQRLSLLAQITFVLYGLGLMIVGSSRVMGDYTHIDPFGEMPTFVLVLLVAALLLVNDKVLTRSKPSPDIVYQALLLATPAALVVLAFLSTALFEIMTPILIAAIYTMGLGLVLGFAPLLAAAVLIGQWRALAAQSDLFDRTNRKLPAMLFPVVTAMIPAILWMSHVWTTAHPLRWYRGL